MLQPFGFRLMRSAFRIPSASLLAPLFGLLLFAGCVSTTDFDATRSDLNQLKSETSELGKTGSELRADLDNLRKQATGFAKEESFAALRESQTSLYSQVSEISKDLQVLHGRFEENRFYVEKIIKDAAAERDMLRYQLNNLETRIKELNEKLSRLTETSTPQNNKTAEAVEKETTEDKKETAETAKSASEKDPVKEYEAAYNLFKEKHAGAREKLSDFLKNHPKHELAADARFYLAESCFAEKDFEDAILEYETLIKSYPGSNKIPEALLKQGMSFIEIGDPKTAKVIFEKLIERYPDTKEAATAKKKKVEIDAKPAKKMRKK